MDSLPPRMKSYNRYPSTLVNGPAIDPVPDDPGLHFKLKRSYCAEECFFLLHPYLVWLRKFVIKNLWVGPDLIGQVQNLWREFRRAEDELEKEPTIREFFYQRAHAKVISLWLVYRDIRKSIDELATERVRLSVYMAIEEQAEREAEAAKREIPRGVSWEV